MATGRQAGVDQRTSVSLQLQGSVNQVPGVGIKKFDRWAIWNADQFGENGQAWWEAMVGGVGQF